MQAQSRTKINFKFFTISQLYVIPKNKRTSLSLKIELFNFYIWAPLKITDSDESQNLIRTMNLWEIAGQARNDNTLIFRGALY
jgi:hypothetical protein